MRRALAALLLLTGLSACGYNTGSMMPQGVESVAVDMFANDTRYRQVEVEYTRELTRELARRSHVVLRDPQEADALIRGRITQIRRASLVEDGDDRVLEGGVVATVEVEMVDARTGAPLMPLVTVQRQAGQIVPRPETIQDALTEVMRDLARDTVNRLQFQSLLQERGMAREPAAPPESRPTPPR